MCMCRGASRICASEELCGSIDCSISSVALHVRSIWMQLGEIKRAVVCKSTVGLLFLLLSILWPYVSFIWYL